MTKQQPQKKIVSFLLARLAERSTWAAIGALLGTGVFGWLNADQVNVLVQYGPEFVTSVAALVGIALMPTSGGKK